MLNKPKNYITTTDDPENRRTVMELVKNATKERIYPVGRLDRSTMGLLVFTNDGELAKGIMHPSSNIKKTYQVTLDRNLTANDMGSIRSGLELEDGVIQVDSISFIPDASHKELGVELHCGRNRIVRRIFEHLGYEVVKLDRVQLGPLTKKNLSRGQWRTLTQSEINMLKMQCGNKKGAYKEEDLGLE
ncbi:MAG: pseudouridine synthase [Flavobacteriales bacterium]|nr:pseudouridine synthase [Flavobacteriales bacterium]